MRFIAVFIAASYILVALTGCGGSGSSSSTAPGVVNFITVSPTSVTLQPGGQQQFSAKANGEGTLISSVVWSLQTSSRVPAGTITDTGLYTAPSTLPNPNTITIVATSVLDPTKTGSASVVVGSAPFDITGINISPTSATVKTAATQQFTATLVGTGTFNSAVDWSVNAEPGGDPLIGTISPEGLYSAPQALPSTTTYTLQAASVVDGTLEATAQVSLVLGPPVINQVSPPSANASDTIQLLGDNLYTDAGTTNVYFTGPNSVLVPTIADPDSATPNAINVVVPLSTVSGPVYVQVQPPSGSSQQSNSANFTRIPGVRIRAAEKDLSQGESTTFQARIFAGTGSEVLNWSVDVGSVTSNGVYTTPASVTADTYAVVSACIVGTTVCDQERLGLHPFRITPDVPTVALGGTVQLQAIQGGTTLNATWQLNGPGSLQNGSYTASSEIANGGGIPITATYSGVSERTSVAVTGAFPGLINRIADYIDLNQTPTVLGTTAINVGIADNDAYVLSTDVAGSVLNADYYWMDVYDLTDPVHPAWINAFEPAARGQTLYCDGYLYQFAPIDYASGSPFPGVIAVFDIGGSSPVLLSKMISPVVNEVISTQDGCLFTEVGLNNYENAAAGEPLIIDLLNLHSGGVIHTQYTLANPASGEPLNGVASDGIRAYVQWGGDLTVYDLTTVPATEIGLLPTTTVLETSLGVVGNLLFSTNTYPNYVSSEVYNVTNSQPSPLIGISAGRILQSTATTGLATSYDAGFQILNLTSPLNPSVSAQLFDFVDAQYSAVLNGSYLYTTEGMGGVGVYDASEVGGMIPSYLLPDENTVPFFPALTEASNSSTIFWGTYNGYDSGVLSFSLSTQPASYLGDFSTGQNVVQALALDNTDLYVGTSGSLITLDVTNPSNPTQTSSITGLDVTALAFSGNTLFAGTVDDRLLVFDITQPANPVQTASITLMDIPLNLAVFGGLLLVANNTAGFLIFNISIPSVPVQLSQLKPSSAVFDVAIDGTSAFLAAWEAGLVIVDFSNPAQPVVTGQAALDNDTPYLEGQSALLNKAVAVTLSDKIAFIGVDNFDTNPFPNDGQVMIYGFDYTFLNNPRLVHLGAYDNEFFNDEVYTMGVEGDYLFVGTQNGLLQLNATQPRNTINLFYLPAALRPPINYGSPPPGPALKVRSASTHERNSEPHSICPMPQSGSSCGGEPPNK